jgi:radical SAM protein (TIGR01212 family)
MTVNEYYKNLYGHKVYKISLNAGMTCPNRDGKLGTKGCIFCSAGGSGDFAATPSGTISEQIEEGILKVSGKYSGNSYIAYFQAFTNTYAPVSKLRDIFSEAISDDRICGLSIATRPDCLEDDKISLLKELNSVKPVWVELGLQTIKEDTAEYIRRGYTLDVFEDAFHRLQEA